MKHALRLCCLLLTTTFCLAEGPFEKLSFKDALSQADKTEKMVFIDFYTTWCGPCKLLDRTTWKDPNVVSWLKENTVALKIDAEIKVDLAKKYKVKGYPSMIFIKPDGKMVHSMIGYHDADAFLKEGKLVMSGKDPAAIELAELKATAEKDYSSRLKYGRALAKSEQYAEALTQYLDCYDNGKDEEKFKYTQSNIIPNLIARLARDYKPAMEALETRYTTLMKEINAGQVTKDQLLAMSGLNRSLKQEDKTLAYFDALPADAEAREWLWRQVKDALLEAKRYAEIADNDIDDTVAKSFERHEKRMKEITPELKKKMGDMMRTSIVRINADYVQVYLGVGQYEKANALAEKLLTLDSSSKSLNALAWNAYLSGKARAEHVTWAKKANDLSGGKDASILDTYARLLAQTGKSSEGLTLLRDAINATDNKRSKKILQEAIDDLQDET